MAGPLKGPAALLSGGLSLGIDSRKILLPRIVHGAIHWTHGNSLMSSSRSGSSGDSCEKVKPKLDLVVRERERHAVVIGAISSFDSSVRIANAGRLTRDSGGASSFI